MKKQNNKRLKALLVILAISVVVLILVYVSDVARRINQTYSVSPYLSATSPSPAYRWYRSALLKFAVKVPAGYRVEERFAMVTLRKGTEEIVIDRIGTNYTNIEDHLKNSDSKLDLKIEQENKLRINGLSAVERIEYFIVGPPNKHKIYFIYKDYAVYTISTSSQVLFTDLDRIAGTFEYLP